MSFDAKIEIKNRKCALMALKLDSLRGFNLVWVGQLFSMVARR